MKQRIIEYDYIRIVAMLLVVACHSFGNTEGVPLSIISLLSYLEMPCNGLFFAVSGALLLPVRTEPCESLIFIKKRLSKVVVPTLVWSLLYMLINGNLTFHNIMGLVLTPQGAGIFWFMYVMTGLYVIAPVISPWIDKVDNHTLRFYIGLWSISLCYPIFSNWVDVDMSMAGVLYYVSGHLGFFVLGYYLKRVGGGSLKKSMVAYFCAFGIMLSVKLLCPDVKLYDGFWYLSIFCAVSVWFYWSLIMYISNKTRVSYNVKSIMALISNLIFGVYFIHWGILQYLLPRLILFDAFPYLIRYVCTIIISFGGALLMSYIISCLPFGDYIVGYRKKK